MKIQNLKIIISIIVLITAFLVVFVVFKGSYNQNNMQDKLKNIHRAAVAGQFYPADKKELSAMIDDYLEQATMSNSSTSTSVMSSVSNDSGQAPQVLIVPHAGYVYSGRVAAYGFKQLQGSGFKRVIIIGRSHQQYFNGVVADASDAWQTPLGNVAVDTDFIQELVKNGTVQVNASSHKNEHSLEVELPFLQKILGSDIKIVPLLFGDDEPETSLALADALAKAVDQDTVVIISSDLSHYPEYNDANNLDSKTIEAVLSASPAAFQIRMISVIEQSGEVVTLACAGPAILTGMVIAQEIGLKPQLLKYANSGDYFPETKNRVVGYAAIGFSSPAVVPTLGGTKAGQFKAGELKTEEQKIALQIARKALEAHFEDKDYIPPASPVRGFASNGASQPIFQEKRGVFVTLKKHGQLRGCIGNFTPSISLADNIKEMTLSAAFNDPRFLPLEKTELKDVEIEISVLSPMQKIDSPDLIEIGKHGVYVRKGARSGVYLPQVATGLGWDKEQFLNSLCEEKAGLDRDCWKDGSTDLYIFTAQVFNGGS